MPNSKHIAAGAAGIGTLSLITGIAIQFSPAYAAIALGILLLGLLVVDL